MTSETIKAWPLDLHVKSPIGIGGLILIEEPTLVLIRVQGPSLAALGVSGVINDPTLELFSGQNPIAFNDDWQNASNHTDIEASGLAPQQCVRIGDLGDLEPRVLYREWLQISKRF